jgi:hypothetical protein
MKPTVRYMMEKHGYIRVGHSAIVTPLDHPNHLPGHFVSNLESVHTSTVLKYDKDTGRFETKNTIYIKAQP